MRIIKSIPFTSPPLPVDGPPGIFRNTLRIRDLVQNINFREALVRFGFTLVIPMLVLVVGKHLLIYTAPLIAYLFITALARFCIIKFMWHRYVKHEPVVAPAYGMGSGLSGRISELISHHSKNRQPCGCPGGIV